MKIAVHASHLAQDREDGNQTYIMNLFTHLAQVDPINEYDFYYSAEPKRHLTASNYHHIVHQAPLAWTQRVFPQLLRRDRPDVLFMPIQMLPFFKPKNQKSVVTIHDLAFFYYPETFPWKDRTLHKIYVRQAIMASDALIAITQATKDDILSRYNVPEDKIHVVYHGIDHRRFRPSTKADEVSVEVVKEKYGIEKPYLLFVGNVQPRKNVQGLIKAFAHWKSTTGTDAQLVIAGANAWMVEEVLGEVRELLENDIIFTGRFLDEELPSLLWGATAFALPSFYEGFGLPILEAAACGTPVLIADTPALTEVAGEAALVFDPHDPLDIATKIDTLWADTSLQQTLIQKGYARVQEFSWTKCAQETLTVLDSLYE